MFPDGDKGWFTNGPCDDSSVCVAVKGYFIALAGVRRARRRSTFRLIIFFFQCLLLQAALTANELLRMISLDVGRGKQQHEPSHGSLCYCTTNNGKDVKFSYLSLSRCDKYNNTHLHEGPKSSLQNDLMKPRWMMFFGGAEELQVVLKHVGAGGSGSWKF